MKDSVRQQVSTVVQHPRVQALVSDTSPPETLLSFALDLAYWLAGGDRQQVGALVRVVSVVASRELRDARTLCRGRPLLAIEGAARAVEQLWPLLADDPNASEGEVESEESVADAEPSLGEPTPDGAVDALTKLAGSVSEDEAACIEQFAARLEQDMGPANVGESWEVAAGEALAAGASTAMQGALDVDPGAEILEQLVPGIGWSTQPGVLHQAMIRHLDRLAKLLTQVKGLQRIADTLGRLEDSNSERWWELGGSEEVVGVHMSGNVTLALPSEMGLLGEAATEDLFYQRWQERRLVSLELVGAGLEGRATPEERGPIIACVDTSGSMTGPAEAAAKALVLALCRTVLPQGRAVHLMAFGGPGELEELVLKTGHGGLESLLGFLAMSFDGGTDFDTPLAHAVDVLSAQEWHAADILVVTDGQCVPSPDVVESVHHAKQHYGAKVVSVVFGGNGREGVTPFSDTVWVIDPRNAALGLGFLRRF